MHSKVGKRELKQQKRHAITAFGHPAILQGLRKHWFEVPQISVVVSQLLFTSICHFQRTENILKQTGNLPSKAGTFKTKLKIFQFKIMAFWNKKRLCIGQNKYTH